MRIGAGRETGNGSPAPMAGRALANQSLLVTHHLPLTSASRPQLADEHTAKAQHRGVRKLHAAFVGHERVVRAERLYLEELQQVAGEHAVLDLAEDVQACALTLAVGFDCLEVLGQELGVAGTVLPAERIPGR